jgi:hypothetical protein
MCTLVRFGKRGYCITDAFLPSLNREASRSSMTPSSEPTTNLLSSVRIQHSARMQLAALLTRINGLISQAHQRRRVAVGVGVGVGVVVEHIQIHTVLCLWCFGIAQNHRTTDGAVGNQIGSRGVVFELARKVVGMRHYTSTRLLEEVLLASCKCQLLVAPCHLWPHIVRRCLWFGSMLALAQ